MVGIDAQVFAQDAKPGKPIEYQPFFPDKWKEAKQATTMFPWEGERVVLLTTTADLDGKTMAVFLKRLDAGWALYADLIGKSPSPFRQHNGKVTIAAVPEAKFTCGMGCGFVGSNGIEVAGFYHDFFGGPGDYDLVRKDPDVFAHYYFYEMGRNYFLFGDRFSLFSTGFAVAMRNVCMDSVKCKDPDIKTRQWIERWEEAFAKSAVTFEEAFAPLGAKQPVVLKDIDGKPFPFPHTDLTLLFASGFLKLRKECGGDEWVRRFYHHLDDCPPSIAHDPDGAQGQLLNWVVAASLAAGKDLSPVFHGRWRFPFPPNLWKGLQAVDWSKKGLTVDNVFDSFPVEHLPPAVAVHRPSFLTPERKKGNLVTGGTFESGSGGEWSAQSWRGNKEAAKVTDVAAKEGKRCLAIGLAMEDDASYVQKVKVVPNTRYLLSGWVKTKGVSVQKDGTMGANLSVVGGFEASNSIVGDADWTYSVLLFDSGKRSEVEVCARLGFYYCAAKGTAWFDDICLVEVKKPVSPK